MVSLQSVNQPGGGVTFYSDSLTGYRDDDPLLGSMPVLPQEPANSQWVAEEMKKFRRIRTPVVIVLAKVLYVCLGVAAYLVPVLCQGEGRCGGQEAVSIVSYLHGGMWFLLMLVHMYLHWEHRASLLHGYFSFHLETRTLKRAALFINSAANAVLVVMGRVLDVVCEEGGRCPLMSMDRYYQVLVTVEVVVALVTLLIYLVKTVRFNRARQVPDFLRSAPLQGSRSQREIGFRLCGCGEDARSTSMTLMWYEVLYWKQQRIRLCLDVLQLNEALQGTGHTH